MSSLTLTQLAVEAFGYPVQRSVAAQSLHLADSEPLTLHHSDKIAAHVVAAVVFAAGGVAAVWLWL